MAEEPMEPSRNRGFIGTEEATIDGKGRVLVSKKKRDRLGPEFILTLADVGCLWAFPEDKWAEMMAEIDRYPATNIGRQQYQHFLSGNAEDGISFDPQGRFVLPHRLRRKAQLETEILLVGANDRVEIWDRAEHGRYESNPLTYTSPRREAMNAARATMVAT